MTRRSLYNILILSTAAAGGQLIQLAATPLLARAFSPASFGEYGVFLSLSNILLVAVCFRLELALPVVKESVVGVAGTLAGIASLIVAGVVAFCVIALAIIEASGLISIPISVSGNGMMFLVPLSVFYGAYQIANNLTIRNGDFLLSAAWKISQAVLFVLIALFASDLGLILAFVLSQLLGIVWLLHYRRFFSPVSLIFSAEARQLVKTYAFGSLPAAIVDSLTLSVPVLVIAANYGATDTGQYSQISRLIGAPMAMVGVAVSQVFFRDCSELARNRKPIHSVFWKFFALLLTAAVALMVAVTLCGEWTFSYLLGKTWRTDSTFLLLVVAPIVLRFSVSPLTNIFFVAGKVRLCALWQYGHASVSVLVLPWLATRMRIDEFLLAYCVFEVAVYTTYFLVIRWVTQDFDESLACQVAQGSCSC